MSEMDNMTSMSSFPCSLHMTVRIFRSMQHLKQGYVFGDSLLSFSCVKSQHWPILNSSSEKALSFSACITCFSPLLNQGQKY